MFDHLNCYATDYGATKKFYEAVLPALGFGLVTEMVATWDASFPTRRMCAFGPPHKPSYWIIEVPANDKRTPHHVAFVAKDEAAVASFHKAALAAGGKDNGAPGPRPHYHPGYFGAFVFDPEGNNIEAVFHGSKKNDRP